MRARSYFCTETERDRQTETDRERPAETQRRKSTREAETPKVLSGPREVPLLTWVFLILHRFTGEGFSVLCVMAHFSRSL